MNANHRKLLFLAGICLVCGGLLVGCSSGLNPLNWFNDATTHGTAPAGGKPVDETGLVAIFGWWSWACIAFAVLSFISAFFVPIIPGKASGGALLLGIALGIAKGFIVKYVWTLYLGFGIGLLVFVIPPAVAGYRYIKARITGKPIEGRAIVKLGRKGKPNGHQGSADSRARVGAAVLPAHQARPVAPDSEPERGGGGAG